MRTDENEALAALRHRAWGVLTAWTVVAVAGGSLLVTVGRPPGPQGPGGGLAVGAGVVALLLGIAYAGGALRRLHIAARMARADTVTTSSRVVVFDEPAGGTLIPTVHVVLRQPTRLERMLGSQSRPMLREFVGVADPGESVRWYRGNMWLEGTLESRLRSVGTLEVTEARGQGLSWLMPGKAIAHTCWAADGLRPEPASPHRRWHYLVHVALTVLAWGIVTLVVALAVSEESQVVPLGVTTALALIYLVGLSLSRLLRVLQPSSTRGRDQTADRSP